MVIGCLWILTPAQQLMQSDFVHAKILEEMLLVMCSLDWLMLE